MKRSFSSELAYLLGLLTLALGAASMERANFGMSMIVAPAYVLYRKLSLLLPFFTFGMAEYTVQAVLLAVMLLLLRKFRVSFLFSFATAVVYGLLLDGAMWLAAFLPMEHIVSRAAGYVIGMLLSSFGVSLMFHTYIAPEVYELFVKELSAKHRISIYKFKTGYDIVSCLIAIILSFLFFGFGTFIGVRLGTILCALVNGSIIGFFGRLLDALFEFYDRLPFRSFFEQPPKNCAP